MKSQTIEQKVELIRQAIFDGVAIVLGNYYSVHSHTCVDRTVMPIKIRGENVLCLDIEKNGVWRQFKFEHIYGNVCEM